MPDEKTLEKAELRQLDPSFATEINKDKTVQVQFNPESLKVSFANQIVPPKGANDGNGGASTLFVGAGTTKMTVQLWFDVTAPLAQGEKDVDDVRRLTEKIAYFITPIEGDKKGEFLPPAVRFIWGSFQFDGIMDALEESLELFSNQGKPLRASLNISLSQQRITKYAFGSKGSNAASNLLSGSPPGVRQVAQAVTGASLQSIVDSSGTGLSWQEVAAANNIENPRLLTPGQIIDFNVRR